MTRSALAAAYDMEGAFNHASITLARDANEQDVIDRVDAILFAFPAAYFAIHAFLT